MSEADPGENGASPDPGQSVEDRLDALEDRIESVADTQAAIRESSIKPRIDQLQSDRDDARQERAELKRTAEDLQDEVTQLRAELNAIVGVEEPNRTSPDKRQRDLRAQLIQKAKDRDGNAAMYYKEIQEFYEHTGHGKLSAPVCLDDMREAWKGQPGFSETKKRSRDGNRVEAIRVELDEITSQEPVREPKNGNPGQLRSRGDQG